MNSPVKKENMIMLSEYKKRLYKNPSLRYLYFELTDKCNLDCVHCGSSCTAKNATFLSPDAVRETIDKVRKEYGATKPMICLTGGEPLLHKDIISIKICQGIRICRRNDLQRHSHNRRKSTSAGRCRTEYHSNKH